MFILPNIYFTEFYSTVLFLGGPYSLLHYHYRLKSAYSEKGEPPPIDQLPNLEFDHWRRISELKYFYFLDWIPLKSPLTHESHHYFGLFTLVMAHCGTDTRKKNTMLTCWSPRPWRRLPCFHWTRCRPHCITLAFSHLVTRIKAVIWQNLEVRSLEYGRVTQDNIYIIVD